MAFYFNSKQNSPYDTSRQSIEVYISSENEPILNLNTELNENDHEYMILSIAECVELKEQLSEVIEHLISLAKE